jgi:hypothetical protein
MLCSKGYDKTLFVKEFNNALQNSRIVSPGDEFNAFNTQKFKRVV